MIENRHQRHDFLIWNVLGQHIQLFSGIQFRQGIRQFFCVALVRLFRRLVILMNLRQIRSRTPDFGADQQRRKDGQQIFLIPFSGKIVKVLVNPSGRTCHCCFTSTSHAKTIAAAGNRYDVTRFIQRC